MPRRTVRKWGNPYLALQRAGWERPHSALTRMARGRAPWGRIVNGALGMVLVVAMLALGMHLYWPDQQQEADALAKGIAEGAKPEPTALPTPPPLPTPWEPAPPPVVVGEWVPLPEAPPPAIPAPTEAPRVVEAIPKPAPEPPPPPPPPPAKAEVPVPKPPPPPPPPAVPPAALPTMPPPPPPTAAPKPTSAPIPKEPAKGTGGVSKP